MNSLALRSPGLAALRPSRRATAPRKNTAAPVRAMFGGNKEGGSKNPLAGLGNIGGLMENMRKAQEEAAKVQQELSDAEFEGYSSDETVRVVMTGAQEPRSVDITEEAHSQGAEKLSELVGEAMKDAHFKSVEGMKARMKEMAQSLGLGGPGGGLGV